MIAPLTPVVAVKNGVIDGAPRRGTQGMRFYLRDNTDGNFYYYQHLENREGVCPVPTVTDGQAVTIGQVIGCIADEVYIEANINGSHLHFQTGPEKIQGSLDRGCLSTVCVNANTFIDLLDNLLDSHANLQPGDGLDQGEDAPEGAN